MKKLILIYLLFGLSAVCNAGDATGKIKVVSPQKNPGWNGVQIQMAEGVIVDSNCGNSTWALIRIEDELDKTLVSVALSAQISQRTVRVFTSECANPPEVLGTIPIVSAIDLGIRD